MSKIISNYWQQYRYELEMARLEGYERAIRDIDNGDPKVQPYLIALRENRDKIYGPILSLTEDENLDEEDIECDNKAAAMGIRVTRSQLRALQRRARAYQCTLTDYVLKQALYDAPIPCKA